MSDQMKKDITVKPTEEGSELTLKVEKLIPLTEWCESRKVPLRVGKIISRSHNYDVTQFLLGGEKYVSPKDMDLALQAEQDVRTTAFKEKRQNAYERAKAQREFIEKVKNLSSPLSESDVLELQKSAGGTSFEVKTKKGNSGKGGSY